MQLLNLNPLLALDRWLSILRYGRGVRFVVPAGTAAQTALAILRKYGVKTYAYSFTHRSRDRAFRVRTQQAPWAAHLLARAGVPVLQGPPTTARAGRMPQAWGVPARGVGFAGAVLALFDRLGRKR